MVTYAKISPKKVNPRDKAGNADDEEEARYDPVVSHSQGRCHTTRPLMQFSQEVISL